MPGMSVPFGLMPAIALFAVFTIAITVAGVRIADIGDRLADRTGLGEAIIGAVFIGATTSLPGSVASILAAATDHPSLSVSNGLGGIAAQTAFLAVADFTYHRANLEHAAASPENLTQGALLVVLLALVLISIAAPPVTALGVLHPASAALVVTYACGIRLIMKARSGPMWRPIRTAETREDVPRTSAAGTEAIWRLWLSFVALAFLLIGCGLGISIAAIAIVAETALSETVVGALFLAVATSMPELIIALSAVRRGALTLAVGNVLGGNSFDVLFVAFSDAAYRGGSIYHAITQHDEFVIALTLLLTGILLLGFLRRQRHGLGNIGFESALVLVFYLGGLGVLTTF